MKLPQISGLELIKILCRQGFVVVRQKGQHLRLEKILQDKTIKLTVPNHNVLKKGTLHHILKDAEMSAEELFGK